MIPTLSAAGLLPLGRYACSPAEVETDFVLDQKFARSKTRRQCFDDWQTAKSMLDNFSPKLVESGWLGGSFTTDKLDPDDIDCLFVLSESAFDALPSNKKRAAVLEFNKRGRLRQKVGLRVDAFILVREVVANPWLAGGVDPAHTDYLSLRGAWDDWWLRARSSGTKGGLPTTSTAAPVRGYLEVMW